METFDWNNRIGVSGRLAATMTGRRREQRTPQRQAFINCLDNSLVVVCCSDFTFAAADLTFACTALGAVISDKTPGTIRAISASRSISNSQSPKPISRHIKPVLDRHHRLNSLSMVDTRTAPRQKLRHAELHLSFPEMNRLLRS